MDSDIRERLAAVLDPDVWATRTAMVPTVGDWKTRRLQSVAAAGRLLDSQQFAVLELPEPTVPGPMSFGVCGPLWEGESDTWTVQVLGPDDEDSGGITARVATGYVDGDACRGFAAALVAAAYAWAFHAATGGQQ